MADELNKEEVSAATTRNRERFNPGHVEPVAFEDGHREIKRLAAQHERQIVKLIGAGRRTQLLNLLNAFG